MDLDVKGGASIKKHYPHALQIFVDPQASYDAIMKRLVDRGKLSMEDIQNRLARMPEEMKIGKTFDHTVFNPDG
ncbi:hypothetical protein KA478_04430 [Patescibacteria group bacterium]|nr:hypothetical protein [Patescibacteria group bacterium]